MLNREQNIALKSATHTCLVANAGSGKTTILSQKYIYLLENDKSLDCDPSRIVALTFTHATASQMRRKITKEIEKKISKEKNKTKLKNLYKIKNGMSAARISTIHSFCSTLMEENATNAGLFFSNFDNDSATHRKILLTITRNYISEGLQSENSRKKLLPLIHRFGVGFIEQTLIHIIDNQESLFQLNNFYSESFKNISTLVYNDLFDLFKNTFLNFAGTCRELFDSLPPQKPVDIAKYNLSFNQLDEMRIEINISENPRDFFENLDLTKIIKLKTIKNSHLQTSLSKGFPREQNKLSNLSDLMEKIYNSFQNTDYDNEIFTAGKEIFLMSKNINHEFEEYKKYNNLIDFNDMIAYSRKLLQNQNLRNEICEGISVMMVDEFQDTSPLQFDIIKKFISEDNSTKLFIVGDPKQSIYGFRDADVRIFYKARNLLKNINRENILHNSDGEDLSSDENLGIIELPTSYRFSRKIASWLNHIFANLMSSNKSEYDVEYENIVCGLASDEGDDKNSGVEFLLSIFDKDESKDDDLDYKTEYNLIATRIKNLLNEGVNPSEIAILVRSKTHINSLTSELLNLGIDYEFAGKSSLLEKQEIKDIIFLLTFLQNPLNNENLACLLKSYFFHFSDEEILDISLFESGINDDDFLWNKMQSFSKNSDNNYNKKIKNTCDLLKYLSESSLVLSISELTQRAIAESYWKENTRNLGLDENILDENLENFREFLINNSGTISANIFEFLNWLDSLNDTKKEIETSSKTHARKIKIMTIHGAKGLEFDHVFLAGMNNSKGGNRKNIILSDRGGLTFNWDNSLGEESQKIESTFAFYGKTKEKQSETAEEKRLLYVAMSRAKSNLYLSAKIKTKKDGYTINSDQYLDFILKSMNMSAEDLIDSGNHGGFEISNNIEILRDDKKIIQKYTQKINVWTEIELDAADKNISSRKDIQKKRNLYQPIISNIKDEYFSASKFTNFLGDGEEYVKKYILGLPDEKDEKFFGLTHNSEAKKEEVIGTLKGNIQHGALEHICGWMDENGNIDGQKLEEILREQFVFYEHVPSEDFFENTIHVLLNCAATEIISRNIANIHDSIPEYSLRMPYGEDFLVANIDLLLKKENGNLEIWDWKSNRVENINQAKELAQKYKLQMMIYAYFVSFLSPEQSIFKAILLFTRLAGHGKKDEEWTVEFSFSRDELSQFTHSVDSYIEDIKNLVYL
jgi:ATP-dependent helicase/nuclease subunit A